MAAAPPGSFAERYAPRAARAPAGPPARRSRLPGRRTQDTRKRATAWSSGRAAQASAEAGAWRMQGRLPENRDAVLEDLQANIGRHLRRLGRALAGVGRRLAQGGSFHAPGGVQLSEALISGGGHAPPGDCLAAGGGPISNGTRSKPKSSTGERHDTTAQHRARTPTRASTPATSSEYASPTDSASGKTRGGRRDYQSRDHH